MKRSKKAALLASILSAMALTACADNPEIQYAVPRLNAGDREHLTCQEYPEIREALRSLPPHVFLAGASGQLVLTDGLHRWVRWDIVNAREALLIKFGDIAGRSAHFECRTDLNWLGGVWTRLESAG